MNAERPVSKEKTDYKRVALAGFLGVLGLDLLASSKFALGALSLLAGVAVWNGRRVATAS